MIIAHVILLALIAFATIAALLFLRRPQFGKAPDGERLRRIREESNYRKDRFYNAEETSILAPGYTMPRVLFETFFRSYPNRRPKGPIPSVRTDLKNLPPDRNLLVWFGHSSYYMQINGRRFLVDPVFSGSASPIPGSVTSFAGSDIYTADDMPPIDFLLITHDHYDHLDYQTVVALRSKVTSVVCGLGVGSHLEFWGYRPDQIIEMNWDETIEIDENLLLHTATARHGSGRGRHRNNTVWLSFIIEREEGKMYVGGDSGYGAHFAEIARRHGPIDLAILDNGQYNPAWRPIHMHPEEVIQATHDLQAFRLLPVHSAKFVLARHPWNEPLQRITKLARSASIPVVTPKIGQVVDLDRQDELFEEWWDGVE